MESDASKDVTIYSSRSSKDIDINYLHSLTKIANISLIGMIKTDSSSAI